MLSRGVAAALDRALVGEAFLAFEEELLPLAATLAALRVQVSGHGYRLNSPPLGRPATVVGNRGDVCDAPDLEAQGIQGAHRGFPAGPRTLDAYLQVLHPALLCRAAGLLGGD